MAYRQAALLSRKESKHLEPAILYNRLFSLFKTLPYKNESDAITDISDKRTFTVQPNIGLGLKIKSLSIDYALTDIGDNSVALYSNIFSLKFDLFKKPSS